MKFRFIFIAMFTLLLSSNQEINAQLLSDSPKIKAAASPLETTIGVEVNYKVSIAAKDKSIEILLPEEKSVFLTAEQIKSKINEQKTNKDNNKDDNQQDIQDALKSIPLYTIQSVVGEDNSDHNMFYKTVIMKVVYYHTGKYSLPEITFKNSDGKIFTYDIPQVTINKLNKTGQMEEIEPPLALKGNYDRLIILIIGAIFFGVFVVFTIMFIKKQLKARKEREVIRPPREIFIEEIEKFKKENYLEKDDIESFVVNLSMIFRKFIKKTIMIDAVDMTNDEILRAIKKSKQINFTIDMYEAISTLMNLWDLSKFAEFTPSNQVLLKNLNDTESFVLQQNWQEVYKDV